MIVLPLLGRLAVSLLLVAAATAWTVSVRDKVSMQAAATAPPDIDAAPGHWVERARGKVPMPSGVLAAHASALVAMPDSDRSALSVFWFAGDRESAPNVEIVASHFNRSSQTWSEPETVVNRHVTAGVLGAGIRRLGNPVAWLDPRGRLHLFVVATGLGGWAAARILHLEQSSPAGDGALQFQPVGVVPLSWLWNLSYLVRTAPQPLADGGMVIPAYFEFGVKTPVALRFDRNGAFMGMTRISRRTFTLQPALLTLSPSHWLALMRDHSRDGKVRASETVDGGATWRDTGDLALPNPDAGIATLSVGDMHLLAYNPSRENRNALTLATSRAGTDWSAVIELERGQEGHEYSYPAMAWADNSLWVSYTDRRKSIAWRRFDWKSGAAAP
jgi:predicted neuraminidase